MNEKEINKQIDKALELHFNKIPIKDLQRSIELEAIPKIIEKSVSELLKESLNTHKHAFLLKLVEVQKLSPAYQEDTAKSIQKTIQGLEETATLLKDYFYKKKSITIPDELDINKQSKKQQFAENNKSEREIGRANWAYANIKLLLKKYNHSHTLEYIGSLNFMVLKLFDTKCIQGVHWVVFSADFKKLYPDFLNKLYWLSKIHEQYELIDSAQKKLDTVYCTETTKVKPLPKSPSTAYMLSYLNDELKAYYKKTVMIWEKRISAEAVQDKALKLLLQYARAKPELSAFLSKYDKANTTVIRNPKAKKNAAHKFFDKSQGDKERSKDSDITEGMFLKQQASK